MVKQLQHISLLSHLSPVNIKEASGGSVHHREMHFEIDLISQLSAFRIVACPLLHLTWNHVNSRNIWEAIKAKIAVGRRKTDPAMIMLARSC